MEPYYELAYALASESLCLFVGTGFSKHLTKGQAPDWLTLLKTCCHSLQKGQDLIAELFPYDRPILPLEECATVICLQLKKEGKDIYQLIADTLEKLRADPSRTRLICDFVDAHPSVKFITTNYDLLLERCVLKNNCTSLSPGLPVNRQRTHTEVYHIHGCISDPKHMVVTADNYYHFINSPNYFSKRLDTLLDENTTVIIGYSLGDINLKSILNTHRYTSTHPINRQHLFFLSRRKVPQHVKDYYDSSYGLRVIEEVTIDQLLSKTHAIACKTVDEVKEAKELLLTVLSGTNRYTDDFLKKREAFGEILATISSTGLRIDDPATIDFLKKTIKRKHEFTFENGAWEQYDHLAEWLVHLGCVMDLAGTALEQPYLKAVRTSFRSMSKTKAIGKGWAAYTTWESNWGQLTYKNRVMIRRYVTEQKETGDFDSFISI